MSIYHEIKLSISSGDISSYSKERLAAFSAALARPQAYSHFGASEFPQVCETVRTLLVIKSNEQASTKIPNPASSPTADVSNKKGNWHEKPLGKLFYQVLGGLVLAGIIYLIAQHFGIIL